MEENEQENEQEKNYIPLLPKDLPGGLVAWLISRGLFEGGALIYREAWSADPETGKKERKVAIACASCGGEAIAAKAAAGGCHSAYMPAPYGFIHPVSGESVIHGRRCACPMCGEESIAYIHNRIPPLMKSDLAVTVERIEDAIAIIEWHVYQMVAVLDGGYELEVKGGISQAYIAGRGRMIKISRPPGMYGRNGVSVRSGPLRQHKTLSDGIGETDQVFPFKPGILEGSACENSKLDIYIWENAGGCFSVTYLRLWKRHPCVENLVLQGAARMLNEAIARDIDNRRCFFPSRNRSLPRLAQIDWKACRPSRMLGMTRDEYDEAVGGGGLTLFDIGFWQEEREEGRGMTMEELRMVARELGTIHAIEMRNGGEHDYVRCARYIARQRGKDARADWRIWRDYLRTMRRLEPDGGFERDPLKPWFTLELDEKTLSVRQNRGRRNRERTKEVERFEEMWVDHIQSNAAMRESARPCLLKAARAARA